MNIEEYKSIVAQEAEQAKSKPEDKPAEDVEVTPDVVEETKPEEDKPIVVEVNGKELTIDELKNGYLRQADYTKKTTNISKQKKELADAVELYEMIQKNPELREQIKASGGDVKVLEKATAEHRRIASLESEMASIKLDSMITDLKNRYPDFDETKVINEAAKRGISDLEFIYKATRDEKVDKGVDKDALREELLAELRAEISVTESVPPTIMNDRKSGGAPETDKDTPNITSSEIKIAKSFGMTPEEYIRNRDM